MSENNTKKEKTKKLPSNAWKPGQTGNPHGRPKKSGSITEELRLMSNRLVEIEDEDGEKKRIARRVALARRIWKEAIGGNHKYVDLLINRLDGKLADTVIVDTVIDHLPDQERKALLDKFKIDKRKRATQTRAENIEEQIVAEDTEDTPDFTVPSTSTGTVQ